MKLRALAIPLLLFATAAESRLPAIIEGDKLGNSTFDERFETFDHGVDQVRPAKPHRWRTVMGYGGALAAGNRELSGTSFGSDRLFTGIREGKPGDRPLGLDPFVLKPGQGLTIEARRTPEELLPYVWNKPYVSGQITTKFSFSQLFGYFEIEARLPTGKGMWPSFWLLPVSGKWPANGELDIFEGLGDPHILYCTVISGSQEKVQSRVSLPFDVSAGFHSYGAAWGPDEIVWYVDRKEVARTRTPADMKKTPMFFVLSLPVGGSWGGWPDSSTEFPGRFVIRRVAAWRLPR